MEQKQMRKIARWAELCRKGWQGRKTKRTSKVMACLVSSSVVVCVRAQCFRGEGRGGKLMAGDCGGEVRRWERRGSRGHCGGLQSVICS